MSSLLICRNYLRISARCHSTVSVPNKKVRSATALLQALANTVEWDPSAGAPYNYIDDPHTIPKTRNEKKEYTLSRASGRTSARWFMQTYPWLFESIETQPKIAAFTAPRHAESPMESADPQILGKKKNYEQIRQERRQLSPSWQNLGLLISEKRAEDAWAMWQTLTGEKSKQKITDEHQNLALDLFSLLVFTNLSPKPGSTSTVPPFEHRYYGNTYDQNAGTPAPNSRWHAEGPADQLYAFLEGKKWITVNENCILIRGLLRFNERDKAREVYTSKVKPNADVATFVDLIVAAGHTGPALAEPRLQSVVDLLKDYKQAGHVPCLEIFRATLMATAFCGRNRYGQEFALKVLAEMGRLQLNPASSPAMLGALLEIFYPSQTSSPNGFLPALISYLENSYNSAPASCELNHPKDRDFASNCMLKACDVFRDADMAVRIHTLLSNQRPGLLVFNDINRETAYYSALLSTLAGGDTVDRLMDVYNSVVPSRWLPSPNIFVQIVDAVELQRHYNLLPILWQEAVKMRLPYGFQTLSERFASAIDRACSSSGKNDPELLNSLASVATNMLDHAEYAEVARLTRGVSLSPVALASFFKLAMNEHLPGGSALGLGVKLGAFCQRLHLTSSTILQQQRQQAKPHGRPNDLLTLTRGDEPQPEQQVKAGKKPEEVLAYFSKLASSSDKKGLPPAFENWLRGNAASETPEKAPQQGGQRSQDRPRFSRFNRQQQTNRRPQE